MTSLSRARPLSNLRRVAAFTWAMSAMAAFAQPAPSPVATRSDEATLKIDQAIVDASWASTREGGILALEGHLSDLEQVLDDTPKPFKKIDDRGDQIIYRSNDATDCLIGLTMLADQNKTKEEHGKPITCVGEPYSQAALLIGVYYDEVNKPDAALTALNIGLEVSPEDSRLISEKGAALAVLHRWQESLETYSNGFASQGPLARDADRARLLRGEGVALTELQRYDEAVAAYQASLKLEPNHAGALRELAYIAKVRAGAPPAPIELMTVDKAKKPQ